MSDYREPRGGNPVIEGIAAFQSGLKLLFRKVRALFLLVKLMSEKLPKPPAWYLTALAVRERLERLPRGKRELGITAIAKEHGINSADTLRRYVAAAAFLERFSKIVGQHAPVFPASTSVAAIELVARWFAYDQRAAVRAAYDLSRGFYSVVRLRSAERAARMALKAPRMGRSGAHLLRLRLKPKIEDMVLRGAMHSYAYDLPKQYEPTKIDFLFQSTANPNDRIAIIIFGPFSDERQYFYKEEDFLVRALGLSKSFGKVVGIVPNHKEWGTDFEAWLDHYLEADITFHYLNVETLEIHSPRPIHRLK